MRLDVADGGLGLAAGSGCGASTAINHVRLLMGIPSTEAEAGGIRRTSKRNSWMSYPEVLNRHGPSHLCESGAGSILVRFLLGRNPNSRKYSESTVEESRIYRDMLLLDLNDAEPSNRKKRTGLRLYWGLETEVGMSRKALYWYVLSLRHFSFDYLMKADDDAFFRAPELLCVLNEEVEPRALEVRRGWLAANNITQKLEPYVYWGGIARAGREDPIAFVVGMGIVLSKPVVANMIVTDLALYRLSGPFRYYTEVGPAAPGTDRFDVPLPTQPPKKNSLISKWASHKRRNSTGPVVYKAARPVEQEGNISAKIAELRYTTGYVYGRHNVGQEDMMIARSLIRLAIGKRPPSETSSPVLPAGTVLESLGVVTFDDCRFTDIVDSRKRFTLTRDTIVLHRLVIPSYYTDLRRMFPSPLELLNPVYPRWFVDASQKEKEKAAELKNHEGNEDESEVEASFEFRPRKTKKRPPKWRRTIVALCNQ